MKIIVRSIVITVTLLSLGVVSNAQQPKKIFRIALLTWAAAPAAFISFTVRPRLASSWATWKVRTSLLSGRYANGQMDRLPQLAAELAHLPLDAILTPILSGSSRRQASGTSTIPIVVMGAGDPVATGPRRELRSARWKHYRSERPGNGAERQTSRAVEGSLSQVGPRGGPLECGGFWHDP